MQERPYGFVAFWKATDSWFAADENTKRNFMAKIAAINEEARNHGIKMYGPYDCSWSCEWRYFCFWECPDIELLQQTMEKLVEIGDINLYNIQHHYVGRRTNADLVQ